MIMLMSAPLESASSPMAENTFSSIPSGPWLTTSRSGPSEPARSAVGNHHRGADGDQEVDGAGDQDAPEQHLRIGPHRVLRLLGHVDRVLEPDQRVEGERRAGQRDAAQIDAPSLNSKARPSVGVALARAPRPRSARSAAGPPSSTTVKPTFSFTDSEIPRKLTAAIRRQQDERPRPRSRRRRTRSGSRCRMRAQRRCAEVMPESTTAKATMKATKRLPKARWTKSAGAAGPAGAW